MVYLNYFSNFSGGFPGDTLIHLAFALNLFNFASLVCISYALMRWRLVDGGLTVLQAIASIVLPSIVGQGHFSNVFDFADLESWGIILCTIVPAALLVFRFTAWKQSPVAVLCLTLAQVVFV
jgi:hypothetical protein